MRIEHNFAQQSGDWFQEHLGRATASRAAAILDFTKAGKEGATRKAYRLEKALEILSGIALHANYVSAPMLAGNAGEPHARAAYELEERVMVEQVGIVIGDNERTAWSPDGAHFDEAGNLIGANEFKNPKSTTLLDTYEAMALGAYAIPEDNLPQLWFAFMVCPTLRWIDFTMRDGGMEVDKLKIKDAIGNGLDLSILPRRYKQFTFRLERSQCEPQIAKMREAAEKFLADVDATIQRIKSICPELAPDPEMARTAADGYLSDEDFASLGLEGA